MPTTIRGKKLIQWDEKDILRLPLNALRVLNIFVEKDKNILTTEEIKQALKGKLEGKSLGAVLAVFSKYKNKESLLTFLLKVSQNNSLWEIKQGHLPAIKSAIMKIQKYLDQY